METALLKPEHHLLRDKIPGDYFFSWRHVVYLTARYAYALLRDQGSYQQIIYQGIHNEGFPPFNAQKRNELLWQRKTLWEV